MIFTNSKVSSFTFKSSSVTNPCLRFSGNSASRAAEGGELKVLSMDSTMSWDWSVRQMFEKPVSETAEVTAVISGYSETNTGKNREKDKKERKQGKKTKTGNKERKQGKR